MIEEQFPLEKRRLFIPLLLWLTVNLTNCGSTGKIKYESPPGYNFEQPVTFQMPSVLNEISGLDYYPKDTTVFAINDEKGILFKIHFQNPLKIEQWKFARHGDYEDLVLADSNFYVLNSKGKLDVFRFDRDSIMLQQYPIPVTGKNEFETLYFDKGSSHVITICKECEGDKKKQVSGFAFNINTQAFDSSFSIDATAIRDKLKEDSKFKPSAAAINPLTEELYLLASVNKALVVFNKDHSVKQVYPLDPSLFKQPEGITFTTWGDLLISNESAERGAANILLFKYKLKHQ